MQTGLISKIFLKYEDKVEVCLRQTGFMSKTGNISKTDINF